MRGSNTTGVSFLVFLVATVAGSDQRKTKEDGDGEWAEGKTGAAIGHFHFELKEGATRRMTCMIACTEPLYELVRAVVDALACRQRLFLYGAYCAYANGCTSVAVMAGYDIVLHPTSIPSLAHPLHYS